MKKDSPNKIIFSIMFTASIVLSTVITSCIPLEKPGSARLPPDFLPETGTTMLADSLKIHIKAVSGRSIGFITQNGKTVRSIPARSYEIPRLVLFQDGVLSNPTERTIRIEIGGIEVPSGGESIAIRFETQHELPNRQSIIAWSKTITIPNLSSTSRVDQSVLFDHEFTGVIPFSPGEQTLPPELTPTDYYRLRITFQAANSPVQDVVQADGRSFILNYAFLLEDVWSAPLPPVLEASLGAAPRRLLVYFCDMFLPKGSSQDFNSRRADFAKLIVKDLIPRMIEAYRTQTDAWRFPWFSEWSSFREGEDGLSVALSDGETWFHGPAPSLGNADIAIKLEDNTGNVSTLDKLMSVFHHELFHNLQRNIDQHADGNGDVDGKNDAWAFFSEGMAMLAASVGQPEVEFGPVRWEDSYIWKADQYIMWDLNGKPGEMNPYRSALYWRFLYEQCGGMSGGKENPAAGMQVIGQILRKLYSGEVVGINSYDELGRYLPLIMDLSLKDSTCPFHNYADSLTAFARAIYSLRLQDGRCTQPEYPSGCGFYDPNRLYELPPATKYSYSGKAINISALEKPAQNGNETLNPGMPNLGLSSRKAAVVPMQIYSGFGMSFVEISLNPSVGKSSLAIEFSGEPGEPTRFHMEVLELSGGPGDTMPRKIPNKVVSMDTASKVAGSDGMVKVILSELDIAHVTMLALLITRLDGQDEKGISGSFSLAVHPIEVGAQTP